MALPISRPEDWPEIKRLDSGARVYYANADVRARVERLRELARWIKAIGINDGTGGALPPLET